MAECLFATVEEVQEILGVSRAQAYRIIKELNAEMKKQGYIVVTGRVNRQYFMDKIYGCTNSQNSKQ